MKNAARGRTRYQIQDQSGCLALFGLLFVASGTLVLVLAFTTIAATKTRLVAAGIGVAHLLGGLFLFRSSPFRRIEVDVARRELVITSMGWGGRKRQVIAGNDIVGGQLLPDTDSDGDLVYTPRIRLKSGEWVTLVLVPRQIKEAAEEDLRVVYRIAPTLHP